MRDFNAMGRGVSKLVVVGVALAVVAAPAVSQPLPRPIDDTEENCTASSLFPAAAYVPVIDPGDEITMNLFLVGDRGIGEYRMRELVARAGKAYKPLGMKLDVVGVQEAVLEGTDSKGLLNQAKTLFPDGERPVGADAVLIFTSVNLTNSTGDAVAGQADCVGGIEFPRKAFVVIEADRSDEPLDFEGVTMFGHTTAKIAAHELAHLFGAHHQYANCVEGIPSESEDAEASPCTVMFNDVGLVSLAFSALEGTVVRGYALEHLTP